jgi:hypothetical protein
MLNSLHTVLVHAFRCQCRLAVAGVIASSAAYVTAKLADMVGHASYVTALAIAKSLPGHKKRAAGEGCYALQMPCRCTGLELWLALQLEVFLLRSCTCQLCKYLILDAGCCCVGLVLAVRSKYVCQGHSHAHMPTVSGRVPQVPRTRSPLRTAVCCTLWGRLAWWPLWTCMIAWRTLPSKQQLQLWSQHHP